MTTEIIKKAAAKSNVLKKLFVLVLLFAFIIVCIFVIRLFPQKESVFVDEVANQIEQEMADNKIVLSSGAIRRTVAEFREPILLNHGKESRLIVYTAELTETVSLKDIGLGGFKWTSTYQEAEYHGLAEYTVDLSKLSEEDFMVNNESKILTVRIPYAALSPINILDDKTQFLDPEKGWLGPKEVKLSPEEHSKVMIEVKEKMKAKLIDENIISIANEQAKQTVAELLSATVHAIDPEFAVVVVQ